MEIVEACISGDTVEVGKRGNQMSRNLVSLLLIKRDGWVVR